MAHRLKSALLRYGLAVLVFAAIVGISSLFSYYSIRTNNLIPIVLGLVLVAWYGGRGPGILLAALIIATTMYFNPRAADVSVGRWLFAQSTTLGLLVFIVVLISGRKAVEKRLRDQSDLFRITLSSIGDAVIATDNQGNVTFLNPTAERLTLWKGEEAKGNPLKTIYNVIEEKSREPVGDIFEIIKEKGEVVELAGNTALIRRDDLPIPINDSAAPIIDSQGNFMGAVIVFQDVSERRVAERALSESEARLQQSQKMEAIGTLTGGIAHDFNNLLTAILGFTQLSIRKLDPHHPIRENLVKIEQAGNRGAALTKKLLAFSRRQQLDRRVINLNDSITDILKLLERVIGADVKVSFRASSDLNAVYADPAQIEQVIMNLSVNARDAMPRGGQLLIETKDVELDEYYCRQYPNYMPGQYAQIIVSDTGIGMDTETLERIFEPFFTTKEVNKGTGLGLSMVYGIVKQHGGYINAYSEPGRGTTFKIFLPVVEAVVPTERKSSQPSLLGGSETILVAEDEETLRDLSKEVLEALGYTVLTAQNGKDAVELFEKNRGAIRALLFDVVMPVMGGPEAYQIIREMGGNEIPLILMTGYSSEVLQSPYVKQNGSVDFGSVSVIQKPYTLEALGRTVRDALDR